MLTAATETEARAIIAGMESRAERRVSSAAGHEMAWHRFGEGPPLVLLHGGHGSWLHWIRNVDALSRDHELWLPDMPSFGESASLAGDPHAPDRMPRFVDVISHAIDEVTGTGATIDLGGFSFGGLAAAMVAAQRGGIRRLALLGPGGHGGGRRQDFDLADWRVPDRNAMLEALRRNLVPFMLHDERRADALALAIHEWSCVHTRFRSKSIALQGGLPTALDRITAPTLLLWGEHDITAVPEQIGPQLAQRHATRRFFPIRDAGHWAQFEQPDVVNAMLVEWFSTSAVNASPAGSPSA